MTEEQDPWVRDPVSLAVLQIERRASLNSNPEHARYVLAHGGFTCDRCDYAPRCRFAFDGYNTDGDCLAEK